MKKYFLLAMSCFIFSYQMIGQDATVPTLAKKGVGKVFQKITISTSAASGMLDPTTLQTTPLSSLLNISLGDIQVNYKLSNRFSFGLATSGNFGNCTEGYTNAEGVFTQYATYSSGLDLDLDFDDLFEFDDDDDDDYGHSGHHNDDDDDDDDYDDDDDDCGGCGQGFGQNILGSFQFQLSDKVPVFVRVNAGYSVTHRAPIYSAFIGYHQKIFSGLGLVGGFQVNDVVRLNTPADALNQTSPLGLKAQMGLAWNF